jgi:hypothetical protein
MTCLRQCSFSHLRRSDTCGAVRAGSFAVHVPRMHVRRYRVGAVVLGAIALWLLAGAIVLLVEAARGTTGDTAREVPLLFGLFGLLLSAAGGMGARRLWRAAARD